MSDPTAIVLSSTLATALGVFGVFAALRCMVGRKVAMDLPVEPLIMDGDSPYHPSEVVTHPPELPVGKVPVWFFNRLDLIGAALVFLLFSFLVIVSFSVEPDKSPTVDPATLAINIGFQFVMAGLVAVLVVSRVGWDQWLGLRWRQWHWVFVIAPGAVFFMWLVFGGLQISGYVKWMESLGVETVQETVQLLQESRDPLILGLMAFAAVIAAPVCEEVVFRGFLYPVMKKFAGAWPAAICSALVFASAHGNLTALLPLFIFGGVLVFVYEKTGSIWAPIAVHFCFNGATVIVQLAAHHFNLPLEAAL